MNKALLLISLFLLSSCTYKDIAEAFKPINYSERDHTSCVDYGFKLGTQGYTDCRVRLDERRHAENLERNRQEHEERLERERAEREDEKMKKTVENLGSLLGKDRCLVDRWGDEKCGRSCKKDRWGDVKCGNVCEKDRWGDVKCR